MTCPVVRLTLVRRTGGCGALPRAGSNDRAARRWSWSLTIGGAASYQLVKAERGSLP